MFDLGSQLTVSPRPSDLTFCGTSSNHLPSSIQFTMNICSGLLGISMSHLLCEGHPNLENPAWISSLKLACVEAMNMSSASSCNAAHQVVADIKPDVHRSCMEPTQHSTAQHSTAQHSTTSVSSLLCTESEAHVLVSRQQLMQVCSQRTCKTEVPT